MRVIPPFNVSITKRDPRGPGGKTRWRVRAQIGGKHGKRFDCGTFPARHLAKAREALVRRWHAEGLDVQAELAMLTHGGATVEEVAREYGRNLREPNAKGMRNTIARLGLLAEKPAKYVTGRDVQRWLEDNRDLARSSLRQYRGHLARVFDYGEIEPNPARWPLLKYPEREDDDGRQVNDPPTWANFSEVVASQRGSLQAPLYASVSILLEQTGMRMVELRHLWWEDIDWRTGVVRIGRTKRGTGGIRFVPLLPDVVAELERLSPPLEDRRGAVIPGLSHRGYATSLRNHCARVGVTSFTPHSLRHRYISLLGHAGFSPTIIRELAGHAKVTTTLDIYSHVVVDEPPARREAMRAGVLSMPGLGGDPFNGIVGSPHVGPESPFYRSETPDKQAFRR